MDNLFLVERNGEIRRYRNSSVPLYKLIEIAFGEKPFINLSKCGKKIGTGSYAEIEQSGNFAYSIEFYYDDERVIFYTVRGGIPEEERTSSNSAYCAMSMSELKQIMSRVPADCDKSDRLVCNYLAVVGKKGAEHCMSYSEACTKLQEEETPLMKIELMGQQESVTVEWDEELVRLNDTPMAKCIADALVLLSIVSQGEANGVQDWFEEANKNFGITGIGLDIEGKTYLAAYEDGKVDLSMLEGMPVLAYERYDEYGTLDSMWCLSNAGYKLTITEDNKIAIRVQRLVPQDAAAPTEFFE